MTVRWARENVAQWLRDLNPEVAVIMFGSNDVRDLSVEEYESATRGVVDACSKNGTIPILTTAPPQTAHFQKCLAFAAAIRRIARERSLPLIDFCDEILERRRFDWDGSAAEFIQIAGDTYEVPTLISRDGVHPSNPARWQNDFSETALSRNGFTLRNYLTTCAYADVIAQVLNR
jgi:lysophospholipase L1-like esterase